MRRRTKTHLRLLLRRLTLYLLLPAALLLTARLLWALEATHRLNQLHADLRAAHIPYSPDAYLDPPIPDSQNAIIPLLHALAACNLTDDEYDLIVAGLPSAERISPTAYTPAQLPQTDALLARLAPAFADLHEAATRPAAAWPPDSLANRFAPQALNQFSNARKLAYCLRAFAQRAHDRRDAPAVYHAVLDILALARLLDTRPAYDSHLTAIYVQVVAADTAERLTLDLPLTPETLPLAHSLRDTLIDPAINRALLRSITAHLLVIPDAINEGPYDFSSWPLQPLAATEIVRASRYQLRVLHAAQTSLFLPDIHRNLPFPDMGDGPLDFITHVASLDAPMSPLLFELHDRALADSRAAALLLAAELFRHDHGRYPAPAEAAALLPADSLLDPFSPDHHPLAYRLDPAGPSVWSVSKNAIDDGGAAPAPGSSSRIVRWEQPDAVYGAAWRAAHLTPPPTTPSSPPIPSPTSPDPAAPAPPPTP